MIEDKNAVIKGVLSSVFDEDIEAEDDPSDIDPAFKRRWIDYKKGNLPLGRYFTFNNLLVICNVTDEEFDYVKNAFSICEVEINVKRRTSKGYIS